MIHPFLEAYRPALTALCEQYNVAQLYVFGSVTTAAFDVDRSDVDFLVEFKEEPRLSPEEQGERLWNLYFSPEELLSRKVDLLRVRPFRNPYFARSVEATKQVLYAA